MRCLWFAVSLGLVPTCGVRPPTASNDNSIGPGRPHLTQTSQLHDTDVADKRHTPGVSPVSMPRQPPLHVCFRVTLGPMPSRTAGTAGGMATSFRTAIVSSHDPIPRQCLAPTSDLSHSTIVDLGYANMHPGLSGEHHEVANPPKPVRIEASASPFGVRRGARLQVVGATAEGTRSIPVWMTPPSRVHSGA
jgi:hypothetical protein